MNYELRITNKIRLLLSFLTFIIHYSLFIIPVYAQFGFTNYLQGAPGGEYDINWFFRMLNTLTCYFIQFAIIVFGIMIIVYGLMFFKSRGSPQGMVESKKALTWGLVGGFVVFAVFTIVLSFAGALGFFTGNSVDFPILTYITCS